MSKQLNGIPSPTISQQVAQLEYQRNKLNEMLGELVATCLVNLEQGSLKCDDPTFRQFVESRSNIRMQIMGECDTFSQTST